MALKSPNEIEVDMPLEDLGQEPPVSRGMGYLTKTGGAELEILTRTSVAIVRAIDAGSVFAARYRSKYIQSRIEQMERLAISNDGKGRDEIIRVIQAGGRLPDAYYQTAGKMSAPFDYPADEE